jgi:hypothetical protein
MAKKRASRDAQEQERARLKDVMTKHIASRADRLRETSSMARNAKDMPGDIHEEIVRRLAKMRAEADPSDLTEVFYWELLSRMFDDNERLSDLARKAGIHPSQLLRFLSCERSISLDNASKLARVLDLQLVPKPKPEASRAKGKKS